MSIASEITRLQNIKTNIRSALVTQGVPAASGHNMADFSADILSISTGGGATITVTYSSEFYNKTMTCTKGATTYTETTTSSGSTVFNVDSSGTWTITCNGVSRTVDVVLEYSTQMAITKTVTVYSAASDTVSFTDITGAKTVTTNANGVGSVSITFIPPSANITFTSSYAKNPNNLSQAYSKTITIAENTTAIDVMPVARNKVFYWYGYFNSDILVDASSANGWGQPVNAPTHNTRNITMGTHSTGVASKNTVSGTKAHLILKGLNAGLENYVTNTTGKNLNTFTGDIFRVDFTTLTKKELTLSGNTYILVASFNPNTMQLDAMWYE